MWVNSGHVVMGVVPSESCGPTGQPADLRDEGLSFPSSARSAAIPGDGGGEVRQPRRLRSWASASPTVFRDGPFRFFFFSREEERLHIHVQSADGEAKVWIEPEIELPRNHELSDQDLSRVLQLVDHEQEIRDAWRRHFNG